MIHRLPAAPSALVSAFVTLAAAATSDCAGQNALEANLARRAGIVRVTSDAACLSIADRSLAVGTPVTVVQTDAQRTIVGAIERPGTECRSDVADAPELHGYRLRIDVSSPAPFIGIGVVAEGVRFEHSGNVVTADLDGDRRPEFFRSCTSSEGVHFTIWSDASLTGQRRWHRYHALGYDVAPTCTSAEMQSLE